MPMRGLDAIAFPFFPCGYALVRIMMPAADAGRELRRKPLRRSSHKWPPGGWSNSDHPGPCAHASLTVCAATVQQPE